VYVRLLPFNLEDETFTIIIKNDGPLIPREMAEKVFEPFFRIEETHNQKGTGIGLPLARSLAELHKGRLEINAADNETNTFILTLPIHQEKEFTLYHEEIEEIDASVIQLHEDPKAISPAILLVEDNKEMLDFISSDLKEIYRVVKTTNGEKA